MPEKVNGKRKSQRFIIRCKRCCKTTARKNCVIMDSVKLEYSNEINYK